MTWKRWVVVTLAFSFVALTGTASAASAVTMPAAGGGGLDWCLAMPTLPGCSAGTGGQWQPPGSTTPGTLPPYVGGDDGGGLPQLPGTFNPNLLFPCVLGVVLCPVVPATPPGGNVGAWPATFAAAEPDYGFDFTYTSGMTNGWQHFGENRDMPVEASGAPGAGGGIFFDAEGDSLLYFHTGALSAVDDNDHAASLGMWFNVGPNTGQPVNFLFDSHRPGRYGQITGQVNGAGDVGVQGRVQVKWWDGADRTLISDAGERWDNGAWHYLVVTRDSEGGAAMYLDGALADSLTGADPSRDWRLDDFTVGGPLTPEFAAFGTSFGGTLDELGVWNRPLTAGEVAILWASRGGDGTAPVCTLGGCPTTDEEVFVQTPTTTVPEADITDPQLDEAQRQTGWLQRIRNGVEGVRGAINDSYRGLARGLTGVADRVVGSVRDLRDWTVGALRDVRDTLWGALRDLRDWTVAGFQAVVDGLQTVVQAIIDLPEFLIDGLFALFVPDEIVWSNLWEPYSGSFPFSWVNKTVGTFNDVRTRSAVSGVACGPSLRTGPLPGVPAGFTAHAPGPAGCPGTGVATIDNFTADPGGYRVAVRAFMAVAMWLAFFYMSLRWVPWTRGTPAPNYDGVGP